MTAVDLTLVIGFVAVAAAVVTWVAAALVADLRRSTQAAFAQVEEHITTLYLRTRLPPPPSATGGGSVVPFRRPPRGRA